MPKSDIWVFEIKEYKTVVDDGCRFYNLVNRNWAYCSDNSSEFNETLNGCTYGHINAINFLSLNKCEVISVDRKPDGTVYQTEIHIIHRVDFLSEILYSRILYYLKQNDVFWNYAKLQTKQNKKVFSF